MASILIRSFLINFGGDRLLIFGILRQAIREQVFERN